MGAERAGPEAERHDAPMQSVTAEPELDALQVSGIALPRQVLALQRAVGNAAVARAIRTGAVRPARARISRVPKNPFDDPAAWKDFRDSGPLPRRRPRTNRRHPTGGGGRGHADLKTTQIYEHYAPSIRELEMVNGVFGALDARGGGQYGGQN